VAAPELTLAVTDLTPNTVTLAGSLTGIDPVGQTVTVSGVAAGSVVTDANGNFTITTTVTGLGTVQAATTDLWGQASNTPSVSVTSLPSTSSPQIILEAEVLSGHEVVLSGSVQDANPAGVTVTFSGAATGSTTTDANGNFSFTTSAASLGTVYAVGIDQSQQSTNTAAATIGVAAPALTLAITSTSQDTVTLTGKLTDIDMAGQTVSITGAETGSVVTDANGNFTITADASTIGAIEVSADELWGDATTAVVNLQAAAPVIQNFGASCILGTLWTFQGTVVGVNLQTFWIVFGGLPTITGLTAVLGANGTFSLTRNLPVGTVGTATAQAIDALGITSNLASAIVR
jgi:large repetitive protein